MTPTSGAVMCQSGTRIGSTKAIDNALKASKKVALPMTMRARTNQRDVGIASMRAIRAAAASSRATVVDKPALGAPGSEVAPATGAVLATDKDALPLSLLKTVWPVRRRGRIRDRRL